MESKHKNIDQLDGKTSLDSDTVCEYCNFKGKEENMMRRMMIGQYIFAIKTVKLTTLKNYTTKHTRH